MLFHYFFFFNFMKWLAMSFAWFPIKLVVFVLLIYRIFCYFIFNFYLFSVVFIQFSHSPFFLVVTVLSLLKACLVIYVFVYLFLKQQVVQGIDVNQIRGLGFDATCSLVVLDKQFRPLPVNHEGRTIPLSFPGGGKLAGPQVEHKVKCLLLPRMRYSDGAWRPESCPGGYMLGEQLVGMVTWGLD